MEIIKTGDGSHTIFVPEIEEHYHSVHGAIQESGHIFINNGLSFCTADPVSILEIGFGTGLNVLLTALSAKESGKRVFYTSVEKYPLDGNTIRSLNYIEMTGITGRELFSKIHSPVWGYDEEIYPGFILRKLNKDLTKAKLSGLYNLVYFDAFSPEKQPGMWTKNIFSMISDLTARDGILVTYCVKGDVKRILKSVGFSISVLPGPRGKRHILRAIKI
jgi:tRNA U34 5-methylaminomethyl-2-thiouridine-forming methyltransferase MnmC